jgi:hypothetical protein
MTQEFKFGTVVVECDVVATQKAYEPHESYAVGCACTPCKNYLSARERFYPSDFLAILQALGVDYRRDIEIYHMARLESGKHLYGGWFYFVGTVKQDPTTPSPMLPSSDPDFRYFFHNRPAWLPGSFKELRLATIEFEAQRPWVIEAPEAR